MKKLLLLIFAVPLLLSAQEDTVAVKKKKGELQFRGYLKHLHTSSFVQGFDNVLHDQLFHNRLNFKYYKGPFTAAAEFRNRAIYGETAKLTPNYGQLIDANNDFLDLSWYADENTYVFHAKVERLWMDWENKKWNVRAGRQRINWGINLAWNSNDLFNAYSFVDFDYEERPGVDAVRVQRFLKKRRAFEMAVKPGKNENDWVGAALYKFNKWKYDFQVLGGLYYTDIAIGGGWAGNIKNSGFKGEATYFHPKEQLTDTSGVLSLSTSWDYVFKNTTYLNISFLYNSGGMTTTMGTGTGLFTAPLSAKNLLPTRYASFIQTAYPVTPLLQASLAVIYTPGVEAIFFMPSLGYSIREDWDVSLLGQSFLLSSMRPVHAMFIRFKWSF